MVHDFIAAIDNQLRQIAHAYEKADPEHFDALAVRRVQERIAGA